MKFRITNPMVNVGFAHSRFPHLDLEASIEN